MKRACIHCGEKFETSEITRCKTSKRGAARNCEGKPWGFAAMDPDKRKACAMKGAEKLTESGLRHQWTQEEARLAGQRGGFSEKRRRAGYKPDPFY